MAESIASNKLILFHDSRDDAVILNNSSKSFGLYWQVFSGNRLDLSASAVTGLRTVSMWWFDVHGVSFHAFSIVSFFNGGQKQFSSC